MKRTYPCPWAITTAILDIRRWKRWLVTGCCRGIEGCIGDCKIMRRAIHQRERWLLRVCT